MIHTEEIIEKAYKLDSKLHTLYKSQPHSNITIAQLAESIYDFRFIDEIPDEIAPVVLNRYLFFVLCMTKLSAALMNYCNNGTSEPLCLLSTNEQVKITDASFPDRLANTGPWFFISLKSTTTNNKYRVGFSCHPSAIVKLVQSVGDVSNLDIPINVECYDAAKCKSWYTLHVFTLQDTTLKKVIKIIELCDQIAQRTFDIKDVR